MTCIPFVNEIGAAIAAEYFTALRPASGGKAFVLVTAGPGLTNAVTAIASAFVESRELLVIGGQVKSSDLAKGELRQRGIQEIDGIRIVSSICKTTLAITRPIARAEVIGAIRDGSENRKGPVFLEVCLDAQGGNPVSDTGAIEPVSKTLAPSSENIFKIQELLLASKRPVFLLGGGLDRAEVRRFLPTLESLGVPVMTTWNGADLIPSESPIYFGRPNTWGQRYSNVLIQQADLVIALGTRLGLQQTGFSWEDFVPRGQVVHVEIDAAELSKGHPKSSLPIQADANIVLGQILAMWGNTSELVSWLEFAKAVKAKLPISENCNNNGAGFVSPYEMLGQLGQFLGADDLIIPCSSGGAFTVSYQALTQRENQRLMSDKGMASMGYGLSGAIGASLANTNVNTVLIEGDGGFAQNLQELGTLAVNNLPVKILLFSNNGYASIRMTQRNYFNGSWIGCDSESGVGFPRWQGLAESFGIPYGKMQPKDPFGPEIAKLFSQSGPAFIEVPIDPEQTYFPKISSTIQPDGSMKSDPLHLMQPPLEESVAEMVFKYI
jgi:acetolactate synthase-1/2/3 large subunit